MTATPLTTQDTEPAFPHTIDVKSNGTGETISLINGFVNLSLLVI